MKITKKRLKEIVFEELKRGLKESNGSVPVPPEVPETPPEEEKFTRQTAVDRAKALRAKGTKAVTDVSAMTPVDAQIEARLQALHQELLDKGDVQGAARVRQLLDNALAAARGPQ